MMTRTLIVVVATILAASCSGGRSDREALDEEPGFECRPAVNVVYAPWGPNGLSKSCRGVEGKTTGSFFAAERGHVIFRALYAADGKVAWEWLNDHGDVVKRDHGDSLPTSRNSNAGQ